MRTGELIKKYRKMRGLTQVQLAEATGLTDSAIRNYELGNRTPGEEQLLSIADALNVSAESLRSISLKSSRQALELLFRLDEEFALEPKEVGGEIVLALSGKGDNSKKLAQMMKNWKRQIDSLESGDLTKAEYEEWRASFG